PLLRDEIERDRRATAHLSGRWRNSCIHSRRRQSAEPAIRTRGRACHNGRAPPFQAETRSLSMGIPFQPDFSNALSIRRVSMLSLRGGVRFPLPLISASTSWEKGENGGESHPSKHSRFR